MSNAIEVTGRIHLIKPTEIISDKFKKRDVLITIDSKYPQNVLFQLVQDNCEILDAFSEGDNVKAQVNLLGREWKNPKTEIVQHFNTLQIWSIILADGVGELKNNNTFEAKGSKVEGNIERRFQDEAIDNMTEDDDLPF